MSFDELQERTAEALAKYTATAQRLAAAEVEGLSADRRVQVRVTAGGTVTRVRLLDGVVRRYDTTALGEIVSRTIRETQRKARAAYEKELQKVLPPEVAESDAALQSIWIEDDPLRG